MINLMDKANYLWVAQLALAIIVFYVGYRERKDNIGGALFSWYLCLMLVVGTILDINKRVGSSAWWLGVLFFIAGIVGAVYYFYRRRRSGEGVSSGSRTTLFLVSLIAVIIIVAIATAIFVSSK